MVNLDIIGRQGIRIKDNLLLRKAPEYLYIYILKINNDNIDEISNIYNRCNVY